MQTEIYKQKCHAFELCQCVLFLAIFHCFIQNTPLMLSFFSNVLFPFCLALHLHSFIVYWYWFSYFPWMKIQAFGRLICHQKNSLLKNCFWISFCFSFSIISLKSFDFFLQSFVSFVSKIVMKNQNLISCSWIFWKSFRFKFVLLLRNKPLCVIYVKFRLGDLLSGIGVTTWFHAGENSNSATNTDTANIPSTSSSSAIHSATKGFNEKKVLNEHKTISSCCVQNKNILNGSYCSIHSLNIYFKLFSVHCFAVMSVLFLVLFLFSSFSLLVTLKNLSFHQHLSPSK